MFFGIENERYTHSNRIDTDESHEVFERDIIEDTHNKQYDDQGKGNEIENLEESKDFSFPLRRKRHKKRIRNE